jgi:hypothetical protein
MPSDHPVQILVPRDAPQVFVGQIIESACGDGSAQPAAKPAGQRKSTEQPAGARAASGSGSAGEDSPSPGADCSKSGAQLVLYDRTTDTIYQLDDQQQAKAFVEAHVQVKGTYDPDHRMIHVQEIGSA